MIKKTLLIDLDGVLNNYDGKYDKNYIPPIKDGASKLIKELSEEFKIVIFTTRNLLLTSKWVFENGLDMYVENVTNIKEPAYLIIDDRCLTFNGNYRELKNNIKNFKPWYI
jgi:histidinol phosphatase-like enzyme